jgi:uncharacterized membrane protein YfcA
MEGGGMQLSAAAVVVCLAAVFLISFMRGAFGGGFAVVGIPLLSLVMDPLTAGALLAPLFVAMDVVAFRYWKPSTWSKPDLAVLVPSLIVGIGLGFLTLSVLDPRAVAIVVASITLAFAGLWFRSGGKVTVRPRSVPKGIAAGLGSGVSTMVAHSGGPPLAMYLLPLGLSKELYAGTTSLFFTVANSTKAIPWLLLAPLNTAAWTLMAISLLAVPTGVWAGWRLHQRLDQRQIYLACYGLLVVAALKLLWDGVFGYVR